MMRSLSERFANDIRAALSEQPAPTLKYMLIAAGTMIAVFFLWAGLVEVEEVTRGIGRIVPTTQMQVVQPFEAGIVRQIAVEEGDIVEAGAVLVVIDDTDASATLGELEQRRVVLSARRERLEGEAEGRVPSFSGTAHAINAGEQQLFDARQAALRLQRAAISEQLSQRRLEASELQVRLEETSGAVDISNRELELARRLFERRAIPEIDFLQRQRAAAMENRDFAVLRAQLPRAAAAIAEAEAQLDNLEAQFRSDARDLLSQVVGDLAVIEESIRAAEERLRRTRLSAPVRGIVNRLGVSTLGAVIRPGEPVVEIVPLDEKLQVEASVRPQDIAFISPGQSVSVKVTAYDYTLYGDLPGRVSRISADTFQDANDQPYYRVTVELDQNELNDGVNSLPLVPGMVVQADILTGTKTVLAYLLNPITRVRHEALREH